MFRGSSRGRGTGRRSGLDLWFNGGGQGGGSLWICFNLVMKMGCCCLGQQSNHQFMASAGHVEHEHLVSPRFWDTEVQHAGDSLY